MLPKETKLYNKSHLHIFHLLQKVGKVVATSRLLPIDHAKKRETSLQKHVRTLVKYIRHMYIH